MGCNFENDFDDDNPFGTDIAADAFNYLKAYLDEQGIEYKVYTLKDGSATNMLGTELPCDGYSIILHISTGVGSRISFTLTESTEAMQRSYSERKNSEHFNIRFDTALQEIKRIVTFNNDLDADSYKDVISSLVLNVYSMMKHVTSGDMCEVGKIRLGHIMDEIKECMNSNEFYCSDEYKKFLNELLSATPDAVALNPFYYLDFLADSDNIRANNISVASLEYQVYIAVKTIHLIANTALL